MKIKTKLSLAAIAASLAIASSAFANGLVGETSDYRIYSYQFGNSQPAIVYVRKEPTVAVYVQRTAVGSTAANQTQGTVMHTVDRGQMHVTIPGGIN